MVAWQEKRQPQFAAALKTFRSPGSFVATKDLGEVALGAAAEAVEVAEEEEVVVGVEEAILSEEEVAEEAEGVVEEAEEVVAVAVSVALEVEELVAMVSPACLYPVQMAKPRLAA